MSNSKDLNKEILKEVDFAYELHKFQMERLERIVASLREVYGEDVIKVIKGMDLKYRELLRWYLKHTVDVVNAIKDKFGDEVLDVIHKAEAEDAFNCGKNHAKRCGENALENITPFFGEENLVREESNEKVLLFRQSNGCPMSRLAKEEGLEEVMSKLHCSIDPYLVKGFNENLTCELRKSHLYGDEFCEWCIYEK